MRDRGGPGLGRALYSEQRRLYRVPVLRDTGERHVFAASLTFAGSPAPHLLQHLDAPAPPQHRRKVAAVVAKGRRDEPGGIALLGSHLGERRIGNRLVADEAGKLTVMFQIAAISASASASPCSAAALSARGLPSFAGGV
jgi:hypothetical protein